ncbi:LPS translocon maturation chaperone LptM [Hydrogenophaga palleronii]|uniref:LPS translocon maturation chaperone LptM n=1 Tax=Hydrogenophaga palleronii TaxID=65655 RepID=UPI0009FB9660|nr:lipoprotein [Hydrogenophaga palleronii]
MFGLKRILGCTPGPTRVMVMTACLLCAALLAACGQKGPLYLPDPNAPPKKPRATQTAPAEAPPAPPPAQPR